MPQNACSAFKAILSHIAIHAGQWGFSSRAVQADTLGRASPIFFLTDERKAGTSGPLGIIQRWDPADEKQRQLQCDGWSRCQLDWTKKYLGVSHGAHLVCL